MCECVSRVSAGALACCDRDALLVTLSSIPSMFDIFRRLTSIHEILLSCFECCLQGSGVPGVEGVEGFLQDVDFGLLLEQ